MWRRQNVDRELCAYKGYRKRRCQSVTVKALKLDAINEPGKLRVGRPCGQCADNRDTVYVTHLQDNSTQISGFCFCAYEIKYSSRSLVNRRLVFMIGPDKRPSRRRLVQQRARDRDGKHQIRGIPANRSYSKRL